MILDHAERAQVLVEALPYIQKYYNAFLENLQVPVEFGKSLLYDKT